MRWNLGSAAVAFLREMRSTMVWGLRLQPLLGQSQRLTVLLKLSRRKGIPFSHQIEGSRDQLLLLT